ncbi:DUF4262 domain-containing protein [Deinococcus soli (ex Cha et al. 2016)]|uniref:DUF4262 domain-containing protein n=2 Tax=Deinococcus soli (ex Cha et al. 2016) TaxID=1309411 RepID=A0AAE4BLC0_9DEIO|nr:DUF4262 domain-containing protein [Deinococcus soli (ex Cha et al. 2016)]MDR6218793.1 hypothetical protein [Deinococcus soli (ex Cha et al. 2016)]MDR6328590.1 hypothetical protein [Deinococcus soli (ex Cha et al. 2016)]MDR6751923.1 hypothetical protein [Deinococcus soli (ex Cha et al. 2016)]
MTGGSAAARRALVTSLPEVIRRSGWAVQMVGDDVPFAYSIGASETLPGTPEVLVFAPSLHLAGHLVNDVLRRVREGTLRVAEGVRDVNLLAGEHPVVYRRVHESQFSEYLGIGLEYHEWRRPGEPAPAHVMAVVADANGVFPWEAGYDPRRNLPTPPLWQPTRPVGHFRA